MLKYQYSEHTLEQNLFVLPPLRIVSFRLQRNEIGFPLIKKLYGLYTFQFINPDLFFISRARFILKEHRSQHEMASWTSLLVTMVICIASLVALGSSEAENIKHNPVIAAGVRNRQKRGGLGLLNRLVRLINNCLKMPLLYIGQML